MKERTETTCIPQISGSYCINIQMMTKLTDKKEWPPCYQVKKTFIRSRSSDIITDYLNLIFLANKY